ncbi:MAG: L,D-transpeptidase family protein [Marmoricola sp.]|nr:L,D-transpeptidase family protein [Marmoricola sp.]
MKQALVSLAAAVLLVLGVLAPAPAQAGGLVLDGVPVWLPSARSTQVVTVNHTRGHRARVTLWERTSTGWHRVARSRDGRIGYGGLVPGARRHQGTGTTPLGSYRLISAFGTHPRAAAWRLEYRQIHAGDYWVEDNGSAFYNRYRNKAEGGFRWWLRSGVDTSERLQDFPRQYEYAIDTSYNLDQVRHRGAGIFLHVNGRGATAGCVSAPRWFVRLAMARLDPSRVPMIAIGR